MDAGDRGRAASYEVIRGMKKGFVLYFDSRECLALLSQEEKGDLLDALFDYAQAAAEGQLEIPARPSMSMGCRVAYAFLAGIIRRDTAKWLEKHDRYVKAARERFRKEREGEPDHGGQETWRYVD